MYFFSVVLQQQLAGCLPDGQLTLHRDGYIRPPTYSPPPSARHGVVTSTSIVGILNPEDGYDAPWDVKKNQQQPQPVDVSAGNQNDWKDIRKVFNVKMISMYKYVNDFKAKVGYFISSHKN